MVNTRLAMYNILSYTSLTQVKKIMIEVKNHSKYHFRAYNFHASRPPRLSCYAAELSSATVVYFCHSQPGAARVKSSKTSLVPL